MIIEAVTNLAHEAHRSLRQIDRRNPVGRTIVTAVKAGMCEICGADDLFFARSCETGRVFFVCAACGWAGLNERLDPSSHISEIHEDLAPTGWTLADEVEVHAAGYRGETLDDARNEAIIEIAERIVAELEPWN